jgi:hypothetical protein
MPRTDHPYSRVYWDAPDDPKFLEVWSDDTALATWLRLLIAADMSWPHPVYLPAWAGKDAVDALSRAGLIDLHPGGRYTIHGLQSEREKRSEVGRQAGLASGRARREGSDPPPPSNVTPTPVERTLNGGRTRPIGLEDKRSIEPTPYPLPSEEPDALDAWFRLTGVWPSPKVQPWLNDLASTYGDAAVEKALAEEVQVSPDRRDLLSRTRDRLGRSTHIQDKAAEKAARERKRMNEEAERARINAMPPEQRRANLERLRSEMVRSGLMSEEKAARYVGGEA